MKAVATLLSLSTLAFAAPTCPAPPTISTAPSFTLVAKVTKPASQANVEGFSLVGFHSGAGENYGILRPSTYMPTQFIVNGTNAQLASNTGSITSIEEVNGGSEGEIATPFALSFLSSVKDQYNPQGLRNTSISIEQATFGLYVDMKGKYPTVKYNPAVSGEPMGTWFSCNSSVPYGYKDVTPLSYRFANEQTPAGCAELDLVPVCDGPEENQTNPPLNTENVKCVVASSSLF